MMDVDALRNDTPGCQNVIHFNNAGASLMPQVVVDSIRGHLALEESIGGYEAEEERRTELESVYSSLASLLNCHSDEVAITDSATRSWDLLFYSLHFKRGDRILTCCAEYASNYIAFLQAKKKLGVVIDVVPNNEWGELSVECLRDKIGEDVKLIALTHVPTNSGLVNPAEEVGRIASQHNILFLLDACQSVGQVEVDVKAIQCDFLSATGRKYLRGPRGTGFLYAKSSRLAEQEPIFLDLHSACWSSTNEYIVRQDAKKFESWEANIAAKLGLGEAVRYATKIGIDNIAARISSLAALLRARLGNLPRLRVCDTGRTLCGIVSFVVEGVDPQTIKSLLRKHRINVFTSSLQSTRLNMESRGLPCVVRASLHYYNTEDEIEKFMQALEHLIL